MGCCYSRLEKEEMVSRCKARKRYMKQLVKARHAFSASHSMYLRSLRTTGSALLQFATTGATVNHRQDHRIHHSPPILPSPPPPQTPAPPPPPPMSPTSDTWTTSTSNTASTPLPPPPPPPSSTWDFWDPFMPSSATARSPTVDDEEWEDTSTTIASETAVTTTAGAAAPPSAVSGFSKISESTATTSDMAVVVSTKSKDLVEIIKELDEYFLRAADSGGKLSALLEVPACTFPGQRSSGKVHGYGKNLSPLFGSWGSTPKFNGFGKLGCDEMVGVSTVGGGLMAGSHCSTVERLYAWEKKLCQEVKNAESLKIELEKRGEQLRKLELRRADYMKTEKAKKDVEKLESQMMVSSQAIESTSDEIVKLREQELYPQLVELAKGLMCMWRSLYESHQVQTHIVQQLKYLNIEPPSTERSEPVSSIHRQSVLQLELEVQQWHLAFCNLIKTQRAYVQSLTGWLRLTLFRFGKNPLAQTKQDSAIYTLSEKWHLVVENAPDKVASEGINALLAAVHAIVVQQAEEQKQKRRAESSFKELEKKMVGLRAIERKLGPYSGPVGEKRAKVEALREKTEEERGKYEKSIGVTRAMTLSNLQMGLPHVFQAVTGFANVLTHGFESVYNHAKGPEEARDVKRLMI